MTVYLASRSPQRKKLLKAAGIAYRTVAAPYKETVRRGEGPARTAMRLALGKARAAGVKGPGVVIGADTLVYFAGKILGKPGDRAHAKRMLESFSGRAQRIYTGVALLEPACGRKRTFCVVSSVVFHKMTAKEIDAYLKTGEYRDKAGAFGLQGKGAHLIRGVRGSRSNIIGLPVERLKTELTRFLRSAGQARR